MDMTGGKKGRAGGWGARCDLPLGKGIKKGGD